MKFKLQNIFIYFSALIFTGCGIFNNKTDNSTLISKTDQTKVETKQEISSTAVVSPSQTDQASQATKKQKKKKSVEKIQIKDNKPQNIITPELINGKWTINIVDKKATTGDDRPYIIFEKKSNQIYANNGCNTLNGEYTITNNSAIKINNVLSTQRYCHDAQFQDAINNAIANVSKLSASAIGEEYFLNFMNNIGDTLMILRKPNLDFIDGIWKVIEVNGNDDECKNKDNEISIDLAEMKIHGKIGCNIVNGSLLLDADKKNSIMFLDLRSTKMTCPDIELETEILIALEKVESYKRNSENNELTLYDKNGIAILKLSNTSKQYIKK